MLNVDKLGAGHFTLLKRVVGVMEWPPTPVGLVRDLAEHHGTLVPIPNLVSRGVVSPRGARLMFAPIGHTLSQGQAFSDDVRIGIGLDPDSGLSARILRFKDIHKKWPMTILEVAGGMWYPQRKGSGLL